MRKPTRNATISITTNDSALRTTSLTVRPSNIAEEYMGSERSRSMKPLVRSSAMPRPV